MTRAAQRQFRRLPPELPGSALDLVRVYRSLLTIADTAEDLHAGLRATVEVICGFTGWAIGHIYTSDSDQLFSSRIWHVDDPAAFAEFIEKTQGTVYVAGQGLPGLVFETRETTRLSHLSGRPPGPRAEVAQRVGIRWGIGFPVVLDHEVVAVLEFFSTEDRDPAPALLEVIEHTCAQLSAIARRERRLQESQKLLYQTSETLETMLEELPVAVVALDAKGRVEMWNPAAEQIFGWKASDVLGRPYPLVDASTESEIDRLLNATLGEGRRIQGLEARRPHKDGHLVDVAIWSAPLRDAHGERRGALGLLADIGDRKRAEVGFQHIFDAAHDAVLILSPDEERILEANPKACQVYGRSRDELVGMTLAPVSVLPDAPRAIDVLDGPLTFETVQRRADGTPMHLEVSASLTEFAGRTAVLSINRDITERKGIEARLQHQALHDELTGLANRGNLRARIANALSDTVRRHAPHFAVLVIDIDRFKSINETAGHDAGDEFLRQVARRIETLVGAEGVVARLGADEFGVLLDSVDVAHCNRVASMIIDALEQPFELPTLTTRAKASIGVAMSDSSSNESSDSLLRAAATAMRRAKAHGGGRVTIFDPIRHRALIERQRIEAELRSAIESGSIEPFFQPIVDLQTGAIVGAEALARWTHPLLGRISPGQFVPIAEECGLAGALGELMLRSVASWLAQWRAQSRCPGLVVSVNLSGRQISDPNLAETTVRTLREYGLTPADVHLEITESAMIDQPEVARHALNQLDEAGFSLHLDDFGTGYSSLGYLHRFPVSTVKIDRSFVGTILDDPRSMKIVRSVLGLAQELGLETVAEGIESREQQAVLQALGCDRAQGYLFAAPMNAQAFRKLL